MHSESNEETWMVKVKFYLCLTKHHFMKAYVGVEV